MNTFTLATKDVEKIFKHKITPFVTCLGIDTASRTGWCEVNTTPELCNFSCGFIDIDTKDKYFKYNRYIEIFANKFKDENMIVIIEESYYGKNVKTFQMLSRLGGFIYAIAHLNNIKSKQFILATTARKLLGFKGNAKKEIIQKEFLEKTKLELTDTDVIDSIILALVGILEGLYESSRKIEERVV
jgi:Holliday junction resolvasome RuvABC endonuclease subunit